MRIKLSPLLLLILCCTTVRAQDKVPAELEKRLLTFTDDVWSSWMKSGDIRSVSTMRVPEILDDPPCSLVIFTDEKACQQVSKQERADHMQTLDNIMGLMIYRMLSKQSVFDLVR